MMPCQHRLASKVGIGCCLPTQKNENDLMNGLYDVSNSAEVTFKVPTARFFESFSLIDNRRCPVSKFLVPRLRWHFGIVDSRIFERGQNENRMERAKRVVRVSPCRSIGSSKRRRYLRIARQSIMLNDIATSARAHLTLISTALGRNATR
jgi:hypothetical protein